MPYDNEYNREIARIRRQQIEKRTRQLEDQNLAFDNDKFNTLFRGGSGFAQGPNEITGSYENELGVEGSGRVTYASVREKHLDQGVYGAGQVEYGADKAAQYEVPYVDFVSTENPAKAQGSLQFGGRNDQHSNNNEEQPEQRRRTLEELEDEIERQRVADLATQRLTNGNARVAAPPGMMRRQPPAETQQQGSITGSGFWGDFADGFMSVVKPVASIVGHIASAVPTPAGQAIGNIASWLGSGKIKRMNDFNLKELRKIVRHYNLSTEIKGYLKMSHDELASALNKHLRVYNNQIYNGPSFLELPTGVKAEKEEEKTGGAQPVLEELPSIPEMHIKNLRKLARSMKGSLKIKGYTKMSEDALKEELKKRMAHGPTGLFTKAYKVEADNLVDYDKIEKDKAEKKRVAAEKRATKKAQKQTPTQEQAGAGISIRKRVSKTGGNMPNPKQMLTDGIRIELDGRRLPVVSQLPGNTGGAKTRPLTEWQTLIKKVMAENKLNLREASEKIKRDGLYKK